MGFVEKTFYQKLKEDVETKNKLSKWVDILFNLVSGKPIVLDGAVFPPICDGLKFKNIWGSKGSRKHVQKLLAAVKIYPWFEKLVDNDFKFWVTFNHVPFDEFFISKMNEISEVLHVWTEFANNPLQTIFDQFDFTVDCEGFFAHPRPNDLWHTIRMLMVENGMP